MAITEAQIWDRFNTKKPVSIDMKWLEKIYSLDLSLELRFTIGERLGLMADKSWELIESLINNFGPQPELLYAAGLCHQAEAFELLLNFLKTQTKLDINTVRALACWGANLPIDQLKRILRHDARQMRLAGLDLLGFKSHLLNATELLELVSDLVDDFREEVVINVIKILQRRNEEQIINCIGKIAMNGTDKTVEIALLALGSIGTEQSVLELSRLSRGLVSETHRNMALKQISFQYLKLI